MNTLYPYINNPAKVEMLFEALKNNEIPPKVTYRYLAKIGFSSSTDRPLLYLLNFLNVINGKGIPTSHYAGLRHKDNFSQVLSALIKSNFAEIFAHVPGLEAASITEYIKNVSGVSEKRAMESALVFQTLLNLSAYKSDSPNADSSVPNLNISTEKKSPFYQNLNININIPPEMNADFYKKLIESIKDLVRGS